MRSAFQLELGKQARVGADAVVLAVAEHHAAVESQLAGGTCGHNLNLGREEVLLLDAVLVLEELADHGLDGALARLLLLVAEFGIVIAEGERSVAHQDVEVLAGHDLGRLALHLLGTQVRQDVRDAEDGV